MAPADTQWVNNTCGADPTIHTYQNWIDVVGGGFNPDGAVGSPMCIHLITDDIYIDIEFQSWNFTGAFSYFRSTTGKGIIPTVPTQPFWTNELTNPITINLKAGETHSETFWVYADGTVGDSFDFFSYATPVGLPDFRQESSKHEITLIAPVVNSDPSDISLDNESIDAGEPVATLVGNLSTTDTDITDTYIYSLTCVISGADDNLFQTSGTELQSNISIIAGSYDICIVSYDNQGGIVEKNFTITSEDVVSSNSIRHGGSQKKSKKEIKAIFKTPTSDELQEATETSTTTNPFEGERCSADQILTNNLKAGDRNGNFSSWERATITEVKILQAHMNRLGFASGIEDGILGPITDGAIKRMQAFLGTFQDGYVGPITRSLINNSCGTSTSSSTTQELIAEITRKIAELRAQL
jgi:hypothetical protein